MPHEGGSEVLQDACALTLGDEPLASGVEHGPVQLRMEAAEVSVPLHNLVDSEVREQPARRWQSGIQQLLKDAMQWHLPLSSLGLQHPDIVRPDANKPPQVPLCCDVLGHKPTDLPRAHACKQAEQECTVQHPVFGTEQYAHLLITQHPMGMDLWPVFDLEGLPGVLSDE